MRAPAKGACLLGVGLVAAFLARPARAGDSPLLVVVEAPPALDADAGEIRRAIGAELACETVAPTRTQAQPPERALIVALDAERITMSLRAGSAAPVTRAIPSPPARPARLRAIAWLAGNLARDQVSPIVAESLAAPAPLPAAPEALPARPSDPLSSGAGTAGPPAVEPAPFESPTTVTAHFEPAPVRRSFWTIGAAAGPTISTYQLAHALRQSIFGSWPASSVGDVFSGASMTWRVEARHRTEGSRSFAALLLGGTSASDNLDAELIGATGLVGSGLQFGRWSLEGGVGAGVGLEERPTSPTFVAMTTTSSGFTSSISQQGFSLQPSLFAAATAAVSHPVFGSLDMFLSVDARQSVLDEYDGYLASMLGLRCRL